MAVVAHPDDCVIFAFSFIHNHPEYVWTICYLTYTEDHPRAQEFVRFWQRRNVAVRFLGHPDVWNILLDCPGSIDFEQAHKNIQATIADQDLVLSHNADGEYGHPHHKIVHQCVSNHHNLITFAGPGSGTVKYSVPPDAYSLDELPLHRDVIAGFHLNGHNNEYTTCKNT